MAILERSLFVKAAISLPVFKIYFAVCGFQQGFSILSLMASKKGQVDSKGKQLAPKYCRTGNPGVFFSRRMKTGQSVEPSWTSKLP